MGLVAVASGTQAAVISTEHDLVVNNTTTGIFVLVVDANAMESGDGLTLKIKTMAIAGGSTRLAYTLTYADAQTEPVKYSVPVPSNNSISVTLTQTTGTGRSYPWSLLRA